MREAEGRKRTAAGKNSSQGRSRQNCKDMNQIRRYIEADS